jgi:hypothetical protein
MIYELSRDYDRVWQLIQQGEKLACWVDYDSLFRDIAQAYKWFEATMIVARGTQYVYLFEEQNNFDDFAKRCTGLNAEFYLPLADNMIVISVERFREMLSEAMNEVLAPMGKLIKTMGDING